MTNKHLTTVDKSQIQTILTNNLISNEAVIALISEREYQEDSWNPETTSSGGKHTNLEFLVFMQDYLNQAMHIVSRKKEPEASIEASHTLRKITAMAMGSSEKNNWLNVLMETTLDKKQQGRNLVETLGYIQHNITKGLESEYNFSTSATQIFISNIFWLGMHGMSFDKSFSPTR
jgi:hypothetical protein